MKFVTPLLGGIGGAAQLSTACFIAFPALGTDIGLTGAGGAYLLWSIPLGALLGVLLGWTMLRLPKRLFNWKGLRTTWFWAMAASLIVAPMAPGFLGLARQTTAQLWQGFAAEYSIGWFLLLIIAQFERRGHVREQD